ncbi:polysaccharide pyruvyl transferase CsaB [Oceanobacillus kimchii]|uniref:polysaccharide pyruvyl transferase CsaB n=1 Tax=Oceanobacillus kimchii TaxID=746691 RepID=UPI0021A6B196|nr:polysaccharide pyruvyl transferase CsaB [Oceanobacillus kimchii]MCT1576582.1 polysaccharide pyruvyl transferase CsaB [Oceanobacillus kimchii]MCT2134652.1 polysaccharide pyruvyl transferase CsaB [Oceanobacillus kimchii]
MHLVISGYYGFDNAGDEAILFSIITALRKYHPSVKITVLSNNPDYTSSEYKVESVHRQQWSEVNRVIRNSDGLISGGGSLFQDVTSNRSIPYYGGIIHLARFHNKPVSVYAQGMGPIRRGWCKKMLAYTINRVQFISVRDQASKKFLESIGVHKEIHVVPDPVLGLPTPHIRYQSNKQICVSVRHWGIESNQAYQAKLVDCLDRLSNEGYRIIFLPMHGEKDVEASKNIQIQMRAPSEIASYVNTLQAKLEVLYHSDLLIGMRLHALIFSSISQTPFVALSYDPKIEAFSNQVNQPIAGHVEDDNWTGEELYQTVKKQLEQDSNHTMMKNVDVLRKQAEQTAIQSLQLFQKKGHTCSWDSKNNKIILNKNGDGT